MKSYWVLDCETKAYPEALQREIMPTEWPLGNTRQEDKVKAAIAEKEAAWLATAPLEAIRGEVMAIGMIAPDGKLDLLHGQPEVVLLCSLRNRLTEWSDKTVVGHNLLGFDVPFLVRRMWKYGISPPKQWLDTAPWRASAWAYDTMQAWSMGNREHRISLDLLGWHLGVGRKRGTGDKFAALYEADKEKALAYLENDLKLVRDCYLKLTSPVPTSELDVSMP